MASVAPCSELDTALSSLETEGNSAFLPDNNIR